jgi:hypothetical protein
MAKNSAANARVSGSGLSNQPHWEPTAPPNQVTAVSCDSYWSNRRPDASFLRLERDSLPVPLDLTGQRSASTERAHSAPKATIPTLVRFRPSRLTVRLLQESCVTGIVPTIVLGKARTSSFFRRADMHIWQFPNRPGLLWPSSRRSRAFSCLGVYPDWTDWNCCGLLRQSDPYRVAKPPSHSNDFRDLQEICGKRWFQSQ